MTSAHVTIRTRETGATATLGRTGRAQIASVTGGEIEIVTAPSEPGFNPLDLLYSSLAACVALSARIAAGKLGVLDRLERVEVKVSGEKAKDEPSRVERFRITITVEGNFDAATRDAVVHAAEEICTVSNTLKGTPEFDLIIGS